MKNLNKFLLLMTIGFMFTLLVNSKTYSQFFSSDLGRYRQDISVYNNTVGLIGFPVYYPNGYYNSMQVRAYESAQVSLAIENWLETEGGVPKLSLTYGWWRKIRELSVTRKHLPPSIIIDGIESVPPFRGTVDPSLDADSKLYAYLKIYGAGKSGDLLKHTARSYVNQNHDDYVLWENNLEMNLDADDDGVEELPDQTHNIAYTYMFSLSPGLRARAIGFWNLNANDSPRWNTSWRWAEKVPLTLASLSGAPRDELTISMAHDADLVRTDVPPEWDAPGVQGDFEDEYDPYGPETGNITTSNTEFMTPYWAGMATLHADKSFDDTSDDITQPRTTRKMSLRYDWWGGKWKPVAYTWMTEDYWEIREDEMGYDDPTYWGGQELGHQFQNWGPYTGMKSGDDLNFVFAIAVGNVDEDLGREKAVEYMKWYRDGTGDFDAAAKNDFLASGKDSLVTYLNRAYWNYYVKNYDIPDPLGAPDIEVTSGPDKIYVKWGYSDASMFKDPDTGVGDFKEWRLYKKYGHKLINHPTDNGYYKYELIGTFPKGTTTYEDTDVIRGEAYHYAVTAVDDGSQNTDGLFPGQSLESSYYVNRTDSPVRAFEPSSYTSEDVLIVPNPYSISTGITNNMNYTGYPNDIHFVNLPPYCTLKIYTVTGDLIKTIEHTSGDGDEIWSNMRTDSNQAPVSGVYILAVENSKTLEKEPLPKKFFKFVIVR